MDIFLRNTNYRKFSLASWLSSAGNILFYLALMTYASRLKNYSLALSLIAITESLPNLIQSLSGYLADRTKNKYHVIVWLAVIRFALYMLVGLLFATNISGWNLVLLVIGLNFISDLSGKYSGGLQTPLIVSLVGENEMSEAQGFTNGISQLITMIAQFAGSGLLLFMSYSGLAIVNAITFLVAGIIYANIGMNVKKQEVNNQPEEVNTQKFGATIVSSLKQVKQANGLLTIVLVIALLNGLLSTVEPLISIVLAGNKNMLIGNYSFTIAVVSTVAAIGMASGSTIGTKIFKNTSLFLIVLADTIATITLAIAIIYGNIFASLFCLTILGFLAGIVSPKLLQWLVTTVDRKILSSSVGLLNTILVMAGPLTTTVFTSIASATDITYALYGIIILGIVVFITISIVLLKINKAD
ncbi:MULTISPECIES: MFS transporter [Lactobacillus]|uniref:MFS transporter n=1 Tax=Lactobacillus TaxID=1578 RepID=UPI00164EED7B|nr:MULTISPECIES: MFS transporter [Lactobacillus]MBC6349601.1 MFS transporter [Lactobacillus melliventris]MBH9990302.1 MFS transporter [Lactobacillus sp. M0392]MBI0023102.1 MFS transporter [Lactobacillus sp. W8171]MBI0045405.1 MFS transporter [Lactobacillus sp. M0393]